MDSPPIARDQAARGAPFYALVLLLPAPLWARGVLGDTSYRPGFFQVYRGKGKAFIHSRVLDEPTIATATVVVDANSDGEGGGEVSGCFWLGHRR